MRDEALLVGRETTWEEGLGLAWLAFRRSFGPGIVCEKVPVHRTSARPVNKNIIHREKQAPKKERMITGKVQAAILVPPLPSQSFSFEQCQFQNVTLILNEMLWCEL